jgi:hypothetical protein
LIRYTVFSKIIENRGNLQAPHASEERLKFSDLVQYAYRTIKGNPFGIKRSFDILFFGSTAGVSLKKDHKWLGRINDYFVLEYEDQSLILDQSSRLHYRYPRFPKNVRYQDYLDLYSFLRSQVLGRVDVKDAETIKGLISLLKASWGNQLKEPDYLAIENILKKFSVRAGHLHKSYSRLFKQVKPKIVFVEDGCYGGFNAWIIKWARDGGMITGEIQHGCMDIPYMYSDRLNADLEYKKYLPDYLLMYGQYWHDLVRAPFKRIIIGNPHFDAKKQELADLQKSGPGKTILMVSQGIVTTVLVELAFQLAQMLEGKDYKIIFRLHPGEVPFVQRYAKLEGIKNIQMDKDQDIYRLIFDADYIVGTSSLTLFEAAALNKKVYVLEHENSKAYVPQNMGIRFKNAKDLFELIVKDKYQMIKDSKVFWADHWRENYHQFINFILGKRGSEKC